jgi:hypothetical protein
MADKKLIIGVEERVQRGGLLDNYIQHTTRQLKGLAENAQRAFQAVGRLMGGGDTGNRPGVAGTGPPQNPQAQRRQAQDQLRSLREVGQGHSDQAQKIVRANRDVARSYEDASRAARSFNEASESRLKRAHGLFGSGPYAPTFTGDGWMGGGVPAGGDMFGPRNGYIGAPPPLPGGGGGAGGGGSGNWMGGRGAPPGFGGGGPPPPAAPATPQPRDDTAEVLKKALTAATVANLVRQGAQTGSTIAGAIQADKTLGIRNIAAAVQATSGTLQRQMLQGLSADMVFMGSMKGSDGKSVAQNVLEDYSGTKAGKARAGLNVVSDMAGGATQGAGKGVGGVIAGALVGGVGGVTNLVLKGANDGFKLDEILTQREGLDAQQAANPMLMASIDRANAEKMMRAHGSRQLMGREMAAQAYGFTLGEGIGIAGSIQRRVGMGGMFGKGGMFRGVTNLMSGGIGEGAAVEGIGGLYGALGGTRASQGSQATKAIEEAVARGTQRGFADPRTSEELVAAMGRASQGQVIDNTTGMGRLVEFLTGGGNREKSVVDAQARANVMASFNAQGENPFYQGTRIAQAKGILGVNASAGALQAVSSASLEDLMMGSRDLKNWGISDRQRIQLAKEDVTARITSMAAAAGIDPQRALSDPKFREMALRRSKHYSTDREAMNASEMFGAFLGLDPQDAEGQKKFNKRFGGTGAKLVSMEEQAANTVRELGDKLAAAADPKKYAEIFQAIKEAEARGDNQKILGGDENNPMWVKLAGDKASTVKTAPVPPATMKSGNPHQDAYDRAHPEEAIMKAIRGGK